MNSIVRSVLLDVASQRREPENPEEPVFRCPYVQPDKFFPKAIEWAQAALRQARKAARRARYGSEVAAPAIGKKARRFTRQMKKVQSVLGEHQDAVIARHAARELGISAYLAGENAFSYGLLYERDVCHGQRLQAGAQQAWKRASHARHLRWMR